ncbi:MAG: helix-turn-helix domain-containing protein [Mycobacteriales bacterium]
MTEDQGWADVGERVRQARLAHGLSQTKLGERVGLDRSMIAKIEAGSRRIDALELARLSDVLQVSMSQLLRPQPQVLSHRADVLALAEDSTSEAGRESKLLELALVDWLEDVRQMADLGFLGPRAFLRHPGTAESRDAARQAALWVRAQLELGDEPIESLIDVCEKAGQFILVTELPGEGASLIDGDLAVAVVSLHRDPGRRRATAAHELGHLILGDEYSSDIGVHASRADREMMIDAFAAELLLPRKAVRSAATKGTISRTALVGLAARYRTSWSLTLAQADEANVLKAGMRRRWAVSNPTYAEFMEAVGWTPQPDLQSVRVPPLFAHAVMQAWQQDFITSARAVELMHGQISQDDLPPGDDTDIEP